MTYPRLHRPARHAAALLVAIVVMAALTVFLSVVTLQIVGQHNLVRQRHRQLQASWLARTGIEIAAGRLLTDPSAFTVEHDDPAVDGKVRIVVEKKANDLFTVTAAAEVGRKQGHVVARSATAAFRRSDTAGTIRLLPQAEAKKADP